jgi:hypothetical protein
MMLTGKETVIVHTGSIGSRPVSVAELLGSVGYSKQVPIISPPVKMPGIPAGDRIEGLPSTSDLVGATVAGPGVPNGTKVVRILVRAVEPTSASQGNPGSVEVSTRSQVPAPVDPVEIEFSWPSSVISMPEGARYLIIRPRWPASPAEWQSAPRENRDGANIHGIGPDEASGINPGYVPAPGGVTAEPEHVDEPEIKTLEALTVRLPLNPVDGQIAHIFSAAPITALTVEPSEGQSIEGEFKGPLEAARAIGFLYSANDLTWDRCR